jgi:glyoxylase-like metal-dependent hydrolase (beta-lactamase superfamily II)
MTQILFRATAALAGAVGLWLTVAPMTRTAAQQAATPPSLDLFQVVPRVHMIAGDGGNITVQNGSDGVVLVDSGAGRRSRDVLAFVESITPEPIRYIINTSPAADFVGGNATIAAAGDALGGGGGGAGAAFGGVRTGAARLAHENVLLRMSAVTAGKPAFSEASWPTEGYVETKNLYLNGEAIQLMHMPATTDGDSIVFFRRSDVIAAGPILDGTRFPVINVAAGGSLQGEIAALNKLVELAVPPTPLVWQPGGTQVIPGRGHVMEQADVVEYRDMLTIIRDVTQSMIKKGMTLEQIRRAEPTKGYTTRYGSNAGPWTTAMFVDAVYASLTKGATR